MEQDYNDMDQLIAKNLTGEASEQEAEQLRVWRLAHPANQKYFEDSEWIWQNSGVTLAKVEVDTDAALAKVKGRVAQNAGPTKIRSLNLSWLVGMAAAVALLVVGWLRFSTPLNTDNQIVTTDTFLRDTLNDGSAITLNNHSALIITGNFGKKERRVRLTGDAFFQVQKDAQKPFIVEAGKVEITVVGTAFHVNTVRDSTTVTVTEGKVRVQNAGQTLFLVAGQAARFVANTGNLVLLENPDLNVGAFAHKQFLFQNMALSQVLAKIETAYQVQCILQNTALAQCPLTARFDQKSLSEITAILQDTYGFEIENQGKQIIFKGGTCD
jgi:transmembrane sensor